MDSNKSEEINRMLAAGFRQNPWTLDRTYNEFQDIKTIHNVGHGFLASFRDQATQKQYVYKYFLTGDCTEELRMTLYAGQCAVPVLGRVWLHDKTTNAYSIHGFIMPYLIPIAPGVVIGGTTPIRRPQLTSSQKRSVISKLKDNIVSLHQKGIIHGDIKPANALMTPNHDILLCDFAEAIFKTRPQSPHATSTPYASPYRCQNPTASLSEYDDIYALGVSAWEIWMEKTPFGDLDEDVIEEKITNGMQPDLQVISDSQIKAFISNCWLGKV